MSQFAIEEITTRITQILDSLTDENVAVVQESLTALFMESKDSEELRRAYAKKAIELDFHLSDDKKSLLLLSCAIEVPWPEYNRGDGYYSEPSDLATNITLLGINNEDPGLIAFSKAMNSCNGIEFYDLGIASNRDSTEEEVLLAKNRTHLDPVIAMAAVSPALSKQQIFDTLLELNDAVWLSLAIGKSDGWTWPEWQYAFGQASFNYEPSLELWNILLNQVKNLSKDESNQIPWISEFMEVFEDDGGLDPDSSQDTLQFIKGNSGLLTLASESGWQTLIEALEEE